MKKHTLLLSAILLMAGLLVWTSGCKEDDGPQPDFLIKIDSIVFADTIQTTDTLSVKFYGEIGPNGCYQFNRFEQVGLNGGDPLNSIKFQVWGRYEDTGNCTDAISYMNGNEIGINGFVTGNYNILVVQPDGSIMSGLVYVKE